LEYFGKDLFATTLLSWYRYHRRDLPWRQTRDPYKIWLSEVILQQTRVAQGLPYYLAFIEQYPTVNDLAAASEQEVLRLWQGLGYYSRARNLLRCARLVVNEYTGKFPQSYSQLLQLPGVGDYTAAAIASIAFKESVPVVDGNVFRVLSRVFGIREDIAAAASRKVFKKRSSLEMGQAPPDLYNQAIMEFGALQCTPNQPGCKDCPLSSGCYAFTNNCQTRLPVKSKKVKVRDRFFYYLVIRSGSSYLLNKRTNKDIWQGLYDFYLLEQGNETDPLKLLEQNLPKLNGMGDLQVGEPSVVYQHKLSHQNISAQFIPIDSRTDRAFEEVKASLKLIEFEASDLHDLPKPILINNYLKADIF